MRAVFKSRELKISSMEDYLEKIPKAAMEILESHSIFYVETHFSKDYSVYIGESVWISVPKERMKVLENGEQEIPIEYLEKIKDVISEESLY